MWGAGVEEKSFWGQSEVHVCPEPSGAEGASRRRGRLGPELGLATRPGKAHRDRGRTWKCPVP